MKPISKQLGSLLLATGVLLSTVAYANTPLPFVGSATVNWLGGNGTNEFIAINKDGTVKITTINVYGDDVVIHEGKFTNPLKVYYDNSKTSFYYYQFTDKQVSLLDENKKVMTDCYDANAKQITCTNDISLK